jgi:hypothetical protein
MESVAATADGDLQLKRTLTTLPMGSPGTNLRAAVVADGTALDLPAVRRALGFAAGER